MEETRAKSGLIFPVNWHLRRNTPDLIWRWGEQEGRILKIRGAHANRSARLGLDQPRPAHSEVGVDRGPYQREEGLLDLTANPMPMHFFFFFFGGPNQVKNSWFDRRKTLKVPPGLFLILAALSKKFSMAAELDWGLGAEGQCQLLMHSYITHINFAFCRCCCCCCCCCFDCIDISPTRSADWPYAPCLKLHDGKFMMNPEFTKAAICASYQCAPLGDFGLPPNQRVHLTCALSRYLIRCHR